MTTEAQRRPDLWHVPLGEKQPSLIARDVAACAAGSPSGDHVAVIRGRAVHLVHVDQPTNQRLLWTSPHARLSEGALSFSPTGRRLAVVSGHPSPAGWKDQLHTIDVATGAAQVLLGDEPLAQGSATAVVHWLQSGKIITARDASDGGVARIELVAMSVDENTGKSRGRLDVLSRVEASGIAQLTAGGKNEQVVALTYRTQSELFVLDLQAAGWKADEAARRLTHSRTNEWPAALDETGALLVVSEVRGGGFELLEHDVIAGAQKLLHVEPEAPSWPLLPTPGSKRLLGFLPRNGGTVLASLQVGKAGDRYVVDAAAAEVFPHVDVAVRGRPQPQGVALRCASAAARCFLARVEPAGLSVSEVDLNSLNLNPLHMLPIKDATAVLFDVAPDAKTFAAVDMAAATINLYAHDGTPRGHVVPPPSCLVHFIAFARDKAANSLFYTSYCDGRQQPYSITRASLDGARTAVLTQMSDWPHDLRLADNDARLVFGAQLDTAEVQVVSPPRR